MVSKEVVERFINGTDDQKYIVAIEADYRTDIAHLIINDPEKGKYIEQHKYKSFLWSRGHILKSLYNGNRSKIKDAMLRHKVKIKELRTHNDNGFTPKRLENGFKYLVTCDGSNNDLAKFFKEGGYDLKDSWEDRQTIKPNPVEQFMIQTGKRMFKGFDDYNQLHRVQFDLETEGIDPSIHAINQIGIRDNKGYSIILSTTGETPSQRRQSEATNIITFFEELLKINADIVTAYNSENFDWPFFEKRCEVLGIPINSISKGIDGSTPMKRVDSELKLGGETERYKQTHLWGTNVIDVCHAVRRAQAINSDIERWSLKWVTKFSKISKKNRVYVPGEKISEIWSDTINDYFLNDEDGDWYCSSSPNIDESKIDNQKYVKVTGKYIVERYLEDDLWETEKVDTIYNQASFLLSKWLPTTFTKTTTMGSATQWKLLMMAWSFENNLAIPEYENKTTFTGGLSFLLRAGYAENVYKCDYAALYPKETLTYDVFPDTDISGVMKGLLLYVVDTRDTYKNLTNDTKEEAERLEKSNEKTDLIKLEIKRLEKESSDYDKKQLPLKILANAFFGAYGAPHIFPWGETKCAEKITCMGRQNLRFMVKTLSDKFGFIPLVGDTDGVNFSIPKNIDEFKYTPKGNHWKTKGKTTEQSGVKACIDYYNETYMEKWMGLDIDDAYLATINFSKKNYANLTPKKVKLVGNSVKGKRTQAFISDFINKGVKLLLNNKGQEFIELYNETVKNVFEYKIPINKIASKAKVKETVEDYKKDSLKKNKNGTDKSKKAHMELIINDNIDVNLGDTIYFVNIGNTKSDGDVKIKKDKATGKKQVTLNSVIIPSYNIENDIETTGIKYNRVKYLSALNAKVTPLLVCFNKEVRDKVLIKPYKDRKLKEYIIPEPKLFASGDYELISGVEMKEGSQNTLDWFYTLSDGEIKYWISINETPLWMNKDEWSSVKNDYIKRMFDENERLFQKEKTDLINIIKNLETPELKKISERGILPKSILNICYVDVDQECLVSTNLNKVLIKIDEIFKFEKDAEIRNRFYKSCGLLKNDQKLSKWESFNDKIYSGSYNSDHLKIDHIINKWIDLLSGINIEDILASDENQISELWDLIFNDTVKKDEVTEIEPDDLINEVLSMTKKITTDKESEWMLF